MSAEFEGFNRLSGARLVHRWKPAGPYYNSCHCNGLHVHTVDVERHPAMLAKHRKCKRCFPQKGGK